MRRVHPGGRQERPCAHWAAVSRHHHCCCSSACVNALASQASSPPPRFNHSTTQHHNHPPTRRCCCSCMCAHAQGDGDEDGPPAPTNIVDEVLQRRKRAKRRDDENDLENDVVSLISMVRLTPVTPCVCPPWRGSRELYHEHLHVPCHVMSALLLCATQHSRLLTLQLLLLRPCDADANNNTRLCCRRHLLLTGAVCIRADVGLRRQGCSCSWSATAPASPSQAACTARGGPCAPSAQVSRGFSAQQGSGGHGHVRTCASTTARNSNKLVVLSATLHMIPPLALPVSFIYIKHPGMCFAPPPLAHTQLTQTSSLSNTALLPSTALPLVPLQLAAAVCQWHAAQRQGAW